MEPLVLPLTVDGTLKTAGLRDTKAGEESGTVLYALGAVRNICAASPAW